MRKMKKAWLTIPAVLLFAALLTGCGDVMVMDPKGPIGAAQKELIWITIILCGVILVPVLALTAYIVVRYRDKEGNTAKYQPNWSHSNVLETIWWTIPVVIIAILAVITVRYTYELEPSKPIVSEKEEMVVQVTSLDWKWLFKYPEQDIATVNYLYIPEDRPIRFELTADAPMNSFWIPQLGGQIYAMSGMAMTLYLQADEPGTYYGSGANFSGERFADMTFYATALPQGEFDAWVDNIKSTSPALTMEDYAVLAQPGSANVQSFSDFPDGLFQDIVTKYVVDGDNPHAGHGAASHEPANAGESEQARDEAHDEAHAHSNH
ncbi:cytochrome aa3 quinol oxidase subunit II [Paenibacillus sp. TRM 82003]|nr:cytochrome aa3 quinol oxidase subunit II [Paenibacillus sp. TRM 82003]